MSKLSITIITLNEEKFIGKCIESVLGIADEIILVDSLSSDRTVEIAKGLGAKVFEHKFDNYGKQKNFASSKASGEWILSLDADEVLEEGSKEEILNAIKTNSFQAYSMPRKNIILGKFIRHSRWQPELDRHIWLYKKERAKWMGEVHEEIKVDGRVGKLKFGKIHYQYENISQFLIMMNNYSSIEAEKRYSDGERFSVLKLIADPLYNFLVRYFYRLGFLDGWRGFVLSYLMAIYHTEVAVKLWEYGNHKKN